MARPCKLNPELQEKLLQALRRSLYVEAACAIAGVGKSSVYRWLRRGRQAARAAEPDPAEAAFEEFWHAYKKALAEVEVACVQAIYTASTKHWQAAAWFLERRFPERWSADRHLFRQIEKRVRELEKLARGAGPRRHQPAGDMPAGRGG